MKLALFALDIVKIHYTQNRHVNEAITALKEPLAQPEQEPIGYLSEGGAERLFAKKQAHEQIKNFRLFAHDVPVYAHPPQRKPLTDEQIFACENSVPDEVVGDRDWCIYFARAIEAKLKENNT